MKCKKFTDIDLITGERINERASIIRYDEDKCGKEGKYFEKNNIKIITIPYYFILEENSNGLLNFSLHKSNNQIVLSHY